MGGMKTLILGLLLFCGTAFADEVTPFTPIMAGSTTISCTSSSAATALTAINSNLPKLQLELQNSGSVPIFVDVGISTITAAVASGYPILPGQSKVISISPRTTHIACIVAVTTTTLYVTVGLGN